MAFGLLALNSCVQDDEFANPPATCNDGWVSNLTIDQLINQVDDAGEIMLFNTDQIFEGYVVSNDSTGNFFKTISVQDDPTNPTRGIQVEMDRTNLFNNFPLGSKVKVNLNGLHVGYDNVVVKVGDTYVDSNGNTRVGRMANHKIDSHVSITCEGRFDLTPVTFPDIASAKASGILNTLVRIENVQFQTTGVTYADAENQETENRILEGATAETNGQTIILRNSGYATFAGETVPEGSGSITCVLSKYNSDWQLYIRDTNDVQFDNPRFGPMFADGFDNGLGNWTTHSVVGSQGWETRNFGNPAPCAYMSGFANGAQNNEDWLVSNAISAPSTLSNLYLSFETDRGFSGNALEVFYTTNFTGDVTTTAWTALSATLDTQNDWNTWTNSGNLDVSSAIGGNLYIAFKYTSTTSAAATWELDNVKVFED